MTNKKITTVIFMMGFFMGGCLMSIPAPQSAGAIAYAGKCGACHALPHPKRDTYRGWKHYLKLMQANMKHQDMTPLTKKEKETILSYLKKHSR